LIILFLIRSFLAEVGTIGDDVEAIDDGPGPASAVIVVGIRCYILFVDAKFMLNDRNQARPMLIS
jgi:hypothetical protein